MIKNINGYDKVQANICEYLSGATYCGKEKYIKKYSYIVQPQDLCIKIHFMILKQIYKDRYII